MGDYYINNGNYRYGHSEYHQPSLPCYNNMMHHKQCNIRDTNIVTIRDDKSPYNPYTGENPCASCGRCNRVNRGLFTPTLVEIESRVDKVLTLVLYRENNNDDKTVKMRIGNKYTITYATADGIVTATGVFKVLSENIPDNCTRYICNYSSASTAAYIGMDCSSVGTSDKRLIYIATIRDIEEIFDDEIDRYADLTQIEKIQLMVSEIDTTLTNINEYIAANASTGDDESTDETEQTSSTNPQNPPPPPQSNRCYYDSPLIIGARPPRFCRWWENVPHCHPPKNNNTEEDTSIVSLNEDLISQLQDIKTLMNSYISMYIRDREAKENEGKCTCDDSNMNNCCCNNVDNGTPVVVEVPADTDDKDLTEEP